MEFLSKKIKNYESTLAFKNYWYGIFINPFFITRKQLYEKIDEFSSSLGPVLKILDVGCGAKPYETLFNCEKYIGIDIKGGGLDDTTKKVDKFFDGKKIPYPANTFDVVIATEVLEHVQSTERLLEEMKRVLKPKGKIFLTMPFVWPEHGIPYDFQRYTSYKHKDILIKQGFKKITIQGTTGVFGTCGQLLSDFLYDQINKKIWSTKIRYGIQFLLVRILTICFCFPIQLVFEIADRCARRKGIPLDFIVTANK